MSFRLLTKSIHAYFIDYPFAIVLIAAPVRAEARAKGTGRNVAFGCCRGRGATLARPDRPSYRARPHHSLLAAPLGRSRRRGGVCHRPVCLQIRWARRLVLLGSRCRCPADRRQSLTRLRSVFAQRVRDSTRAQRVRHDGPTHSAPHLTRLYLMRQRRLDRPSSSSAL